MNKKALLYMCAGLLLTAFAALCFVEFFFAWNASQGPMYFWHGSENFSIDIIRSFPINERRYIQGFPKVFTLDLILESITGATETHGSVSVPLGFLTFTKEHWLLGALLCMGACIALIRALKPEWISSKALATPFIMLTVLTVWMLIKDFVGSWQYMYGAKELGIIPRWQDYRSFESLGATEPSKFLAFLPILLQAVQNLLLCATFASVVWVVSSNSGKGLFFLPAALAALSGIVAFICNLTGLGFSLKWEFGSALIFLITDALLAFGLFVYGMAAREE